MTAINTKTINDIVDDFAFFDSADEKYTYIIDLGKKLPPMPDALKNDVTRVDGCMSQVWLTCDTQTIAKENGDEQTVLQFQGDSDSIIARGLVGLVLELYNNKPPTDIMANDAIEMFSQIGFGDSISMNRRSGFSAMVNRIQTFAKNSQ